MNVMVTGVAGFIGSNFVYHILENTDNITIIGIDKLTYAGNLENLSKIDPKYKKRFIFKKADICDKKTINSIFEEYDILGVINFAAESHVDRSIHSPEDFMVTNVVGTQVLLDTAKRFWYKDKMWKANCRFLQISTDEVYGSLGPTGLFSETTPLDPHSPYSASKAGGDLIVKAYHDTYGMPAMITRCSNNYGPYQFPEKLIPLIIKNSLEHKSIPVYGSGDNIRDWLYVEDHCDAILKVFLNSENGKVYNIGGSNEMKNLDIVKIILNLVSKKVEDPAINENLITFVEDRLGHDKRYGIDASKIKKDLGWQPATNFETGISKTIDWYLENLDWLTHVVSGEYQRFYELNYKK